MTFRRKYTWFAAPGALLLAGAAAWVLFDSPAIPDASVPAGRPARIRPDYDGATIPPNIAPMNFAIEEPGDSFRVRISGPAGGPIDLASRDGAVSIPPDRWSRLLESNRGGPIDVDVYARRPDGRWLRYDSLRLRVARENIDSHLVYRLLGAAFDRWGQMGLYQRNLQTFEETPILRNSRIANGCVNCHSFAGNGDPGRFSLQVRPPGNTAFPGGMIAVHGRQVRRLNPRGLPPLAPPGYTSWHPLGPIAAFSQNRVSQFMHGAGIEVREVFDHDSDLALLDLSGGTAFTGPRIADPQRLETFPAWAADGKSLFFCSAPAPPAGSSGPPYDTYQDIRYDLMRVRRDEAGAWGEPATLLAAADTHRSISEPRASPDGRFLVFCMAGHGAFPVLEADSDLYMMKLDSPAPPAYRALDKANSDQADSWHCWSSNSRWLVFSSKRGNGLLARPYICHVDETGNEGKPFVMPQKDPRFYDRFLKTYNVPELTRGPVTVGEKELSEAILSAPSHALTSASPRP